MGEVGIRTTIFRPATFIERSLENLGHSMLVGCVLVVVVLVLFLFDWRCAVISATAIPLSLIAAMLVLYYRGGTINTMVLAGLVIALGEVVDDAIIDVENIMRRLRLNSVAESPFIVLVVFDASMEVRSAVVYATIIVVLAFLPVFFLRTRRCVLQAPCSGLYSCHPRLSGSCIDSHSSHVLVSTAKSATKRHIDGPLVLFFKRVYRLALGTAVRFRWATLIVTSVIFLGIAGTINATGEQLMPKFRETDFLMHWVEKPGIGIDAMDRSHCVQAKR